MRWLVLKIIVLLDVNCFHRETELNAVTTTSTRREWFAINTRHLMFLAMICVMEYIVDAGLFDRIARLECVPNVCAHKETPSGEGGDCTT